MANRSIVSRLIWLLASALAGLWLLGSVAAAMLTRFEVNERLDNTLEEVAQRLMPVAEGSLSEPEATAEPSRPNFSSRGTPRVGRCQESPRCGSGH
jgi:two-component system OmpR family sensor kinase